MATEAEKKRAHEMRKSETVSAYNAAESRVQNRLVKDGRACYVVTGLMQRFREDKLNLIKALDRMTITQKMALGRLLGDWVK